MTSFRLHAAPVPLYYQMEQHLAGRIRGGEFRRGAALPTEDELGTQYGVSRITVRRALDALAAEGLIVRRRGVGTFVASPDEQVRTMTLVGALEDLLSSRRHMTFKVLSRDAVDAAPFVGQALGVATGSPVGRLRVIACERGGPFAYAEFFFPEDVARRIRASDVTSRTPVLRVVEEKIGQRIRRAEQVVEPALADREVAACLGVKPRTAILKVVRTHYADDGRAVEVAVVHYHPERYRYSVHFTTRAAALPAAVRTPAEQGGRTS